MSREMETERIVNLAELEQLIAAGINERNKEAIK